MNLSFEQPIWLLLLPLGALFLPLLIRYQRRRSPLVYAFDGSEKIIGHHNFFFRLLLFFSYTCSFLAAVVTIVALAGPTQIRHHRTPPQYANQLIFVLDLSPSMATVNQLGQSRLDNARSEIQRFVSRQKNTAIGLVAFASEAALVVPPSPSYQILQERLDQLQVSMLGDGTAIGTGLAVAANHLRDPGTNRTVVLISDGGNNTGAIQPEIAFRLLRQQKIDLFVIALENPGDDEVLLRSPDTGELYRARLNTPQNWDDLRAMMAAEGVGQFFSIGALDSLEKVMFNLSYSEIEPASSQQETSKVYFHSSLIILAIILFLSGWLIPKLVLREI